MPRLTIEVTGLRELRTQLKAMDADLPKQVKVALNAAAELVISYAKPKIPKRSGAAAASLKARSGQLDARIAAGGRRAAYYPWLDFGGAVGRADSVRRPFYVEGRYIYVGLRENRAEITELMQRGLTELATGAGFEVT